MSRKTKQLLYVLAALALLLALWSVQAPLSRMREESDLNPAVQAPSEVIPVLVLGGLRGVVVDALWIRALARAEQKRYFEIRPIVDLMARLQPTIPEVWKFQAWNMAYNIAHEMHSKEGRWRWVRSGLEYLERGCAKNPGNADMRAYLAHLYTHRFSPTFFSDDYAYFREQLAKKGQDNYELAVKWLREALQCNPPRLRASLFNRQMIHALAAAAALARDEKRWGDAFRYYDRCLRAWDAYRKDYPDEFMTYANGYTDAIAGRAETYTKAGLDAEEKGQAARAQRYFMEAIRGYRVLTQGMGLPLLPYHRRLFETAQRMLK